MTDGVMREREREKKREKYRAWVCIAERRERIRERGGKRDRPCSSQLRSGASLARPP